MDSKVVEEEELTIIAIDGDKNSQHAVKWAVEHLLKKNSSCTLIHVTTNNLFPNNFEALPKQSRPPTEDELQQFFLPFRGFCARKGIVAKELVLHGVDVAKVLTEYIIHNSINNIVVGASRWNAFIRKFKDVDVPTSLIKYVPETCAIHVISKRKVQNIRPACQSKNISIAPSKSLKDIKGRYEPEVLNRKSKSLKYGFWQGSSNDGVFFGQNKDPTQKSLEMEIKKLKLEQKGEIKKCSSTCKVAATTKQKAIKLENFRQEEWDIEKARLAEETLESTEMSKRMAEIKSQKGKQTETRAIHEEEERNITLNASAPDKPLFKRYNIKEIEVATNYFDNDLQIGEGGYGPVFKGVLDDIDVAIKALRPDITQGEKQFHQEVTVLSTIRHPNMVKLLGACPEFGCLVYEYVENGSLEDRLFQKDNTPTIPWKVRFKIASEIATGLLFLHQTKPEPIVHRDLKPANILLDRNYGSKITDVGLARLVPPSVANKTTEYYKTTAAGTFCYIDPEYQQTGLLGVKSDIYSLGVMLLQIITGKPPMGVAHLVQDAINKGEFKEVLDPNVTDWPLEETLSYARLALKCCEMKKRDRPNLASVILPELIRLRNLGEVAIDIDIVSAKQEGNE
ncbi:U-box domain-containing protein 34 [Cajanus cajan]|uniref:U-box domain-containing protein 34 n=1 Tax=Cajanus cajan TaxID=3821 RepID=UPI00098DD08D|nr:U-box domain-containing protein 34 [Cajanus cajan]